MFNLIVVSSKEGGIGHDNKLPWHISEELKLFKKITDGHILIMGRKTIESLPELKSRVMICVSSKKTLSLNTLVKIGNNMCYIVKSVKMGIIYANIISNNSKVFIAGGKTIYQEVFTNYVDQIDKVYLSIVNKSYNCNVKIDKFWETFKWFVDEKQHYDEFVHYVLSPNFTGLGEEKYLKLLREVSEVGFEKDGRNGITKSVFGKTLDFDLREGFPLLTTKKMFFRGVVEELLFFIRGETDSKLLEEKKINIWRGNTNRKFLDSLNMKNRKEGIMGPMYGWNWRHFGAPYDEETGGPKTSEKGMDQLADVIRKIREEPHSRRILLTDYNPLEASNGVLFPCHSVILQFYVSDGFLDMFCYNRSSDLFHGLPFNIASSSLLLFLISKITGLVARKFILSLGDCHIYESHYEVVKKQLSRIPYKFPEIKIKKEIVEIADIEKLNYTDFEITNYFYYPTIKADMVA